MVKRAPFTVQNIKRNTWLATGRDEGIDASTDEMFPTPRQGTLSYVPVSWIPYAQLIRLDKPIGFVIVYLPYLIGLLYAACIAPDAIPTNKLLDRAQIFLFGSIILRSTGCAWDDIVDQDYDRKVKRCRVRPIPRGALSTSNAVIFTLALGSTGLCSLILLPHECLFDAGFIIVLSLIYPYLKRITNYTQVVLGVAIGFAIIMAAHSLEIDPLTSTTCISTLSLYFSIVLMMVLYDIIYARQDTNDDVAAGVKSMAVYFRDHIEQLVWALSLLIVILLSMTGIFSCMSIMYYLTAVGGTGCSLCAMVMLMDLDSAESYHRCVGTAYMLSSICILGGFWQEYIWRA